MAETQRLLSMILWHILDVLGVVLSGQNDHLINNNLVCFNFVIMPEVG